MIHFESDYLEGCCPQILEALQETNLEQTLGYGEDFHCAKAADMIRYVFDCPDAEVHFLVGGTQTNATVITGALRMGSPIAAAAAAGIPGGIGSDRRAAPNFSSISRLRMTVKCQGWRFMPVGAYSPAVTMVSSASSGIGLPSNTL